MIYKFTATQEERDYLRELAKKYLEYAKLPIMEERKKLWYAHNARRADRPVIVMEEMSFENDIIPELKCVSEAAKEIEKRLLIPISSFDLIGDDKVISPYYEVFWDIDIPKYGVEIERKYAEDSTGRKLGFSEQHPIVDLHEDFHKLKHCTYNVNREKTNSWKNFVEEMIGDILPVKMNNFSLYWNLTPSQRIVELMGLEQMMYSMVDYPEEMHALYKFIQDDIEAFIQWQQKEGLLILNNENHYAGAGSYGFTHELPTEHYNQTGIITSKDLWGNFNSQETVGISPDMFGEFIFPYYKELAKNFGMVYYGCCEPVHVIWDDYISKLPGLRKVSVSAWCDEIFMGSRLKGSDVIYSRKPSPNFVGVEGMFDESAFTTYIGKTLEAAKGCKLEFIFRDIYTLSGDISKPGKAVRIVREQIEKMW